MDKVDAVCMDHDMCYDVGIARSSCDEAMSNSLLEVHDEGHSLGFYGNAANLYMDVVGNNSERRNLKQLLSAQGKTLAHLHPWSDLEYFKNKPGGGKPSKNARKRAARAKNVTVSSSANGGIRISAGGKATKRKSRGSRRGQQKSRRKNGLKRNRRLAKKRGFNVSDYGQLALSWRVDRMKGRRGENGIILSGCDLIDTIQVRNANGTGNIGSNNPGSILTNYNGTAPQGWLLNPLNFTNSRQRQFAQLFQKFRYKKIRFHFVSSQTTFIAGSYLHYTDFDPETSYGSSNATNNALQYAVAHSNATPGHVSKSSTNVFIPHDPEAAYWIKQQESTRTFTQGQYFWMLADPISTITGTVTYPFTIGRVFMEYEIEFWEDSIGEGTDTADPPGPVGGEYIGWVSTYNTGTFTASQDVINVSGVATAQSNLGQSVPPNAGNLSSPLANSYISTSTTSSTATLNLVGLTPGDTYEVIFVAAVAGNSAWTATTTTGLPTLTVSGNITVINKILMLAADTVIGGNHTLYYSLKLSFSTTLETGTIAMTAWSAATGGGTLQALICSSWIVRNYRGTKHLSCKLDKMVDGGAPLHKVLSNLSQMCHYKDCKTCTSFRFLRTGDVTSLSIHEKPTEKSVSFTQADNLYQSNDPAITWTPMSGCCPSSDDESSEEERDLLMKLFKKKLKKKERKVLHCEDEREAVDSAAESAFETALSLVAEKRKRHKSLEMNHKN